MELVNESELIEQLQDPAQQTAAFTKVVKLYSEKLYWQIRRMVLSHDDANDLLQNTFVKAWMNIEMFRGSSKISTWLYRIAFNETLTFLNKRNANMPLSMDDPEADTMNQLESDPYFDGDATQEKFQQALQLLPPKQRIVFNMKYYDDIKYEDMSEVLGTSVGALKASYHLAVKKIEDFLNK